MFSNFKDGKFWNNWRRSTIATTNVQDVVDVLDSDHSLTSPEEIALFYEKKKFILSAFDKVLHTDMCKNMFENMIMTSTLKKFTRK